MKKLLSILIIGLFLNPLFSQEEEKPESAAASLDELLELVKQGRFAESEEASERKPDLELKETDNKNFYLMQKLKGPVWRGLQKNLRLNLKQTMQNLLF